MTLVRFEPFPELDRWTERALTSLPAAGHVPRRAMR
jgi:hypothetical protein